MRLLFFSLAIPLLVSCSSARVANTWKSVNPQKPSNILVMVLMPPGEEHFSQDLESHVANDLLCIGYNAYAQHNLNDEMLRLESESQTSANLKAHKIDAVLTMALLNWKNERKEMPDNLWISPYNRYNCQLLCYLPAVGGKLARAYKSGRYIWECNLYDATSLNLQYALRTKPVARKNTLKNSYDYSHALISDLVWQQLLFPAPQR